MSTAAQVRELVTPFVERNDDLTLIGRAIILEPVHHFVRGIYLDRTSSKGQIRPFWYIRLLCMPHVKGWSNELPIHGAYVDDPRIKDSLEWHLHACLGEFLRPTSEMRSLWNVPARHSGRRDLWPLQECLLVAAEGNFEHAANGLSQHVAEEELLLRREHDGIDSHHRPQSRPWQRAMERHREELKKLGHKQRLLEVLKTRDKAAVAKLLHGWERQTSKAEGLDSVWQELPFPFEAKRHRGHSVPTTSVPAIKRWMEPLLHGREDLALAGRQLVLKPVGHFVRGISFETSHTGIRLRPSWFASLTFTPPGDEQHQIGRLLTEVDPASDNFEALLRWRCEFVIGRRLGGIVDIASFQRDIERRKYMNARGHSAFDHLDYRQGTMAAALGHFDDADRALRMPIRHREDHLEHDERLRRRLAKSSDRAGERIVEERMATELARIAEVKRLLALVEARDRAGVAALLHEWERENVKKWGIEHLWEPTPFPVERPVGR